MVRRKESGKVQRDAIRMGVRKAASGCDGCANGYFDLARANGASDDDIEQALSQASSEDIRAYVTRRQVLKGLGFGVAGTAAVASGLLPLEAAATSDSFGVDTNTTNCCSMPYTFYIGRFGYATTQTTSGFNVTAAGQCPNYNYSYGYWDLDGPNWPGANSDPYTWGKNQASAAQYGWFHNPNAPYFFGQTIFADVEAGEGWDGPINQSKNQSVFQGWLDQMRNYPGYTFVPGLYISPGNWNSYFGSGYVPSTGGNGFSLWLTGCKTCAIQCAPQNNGCGGTVTQAQNTWVNYAGQTILGGAGAVVWQYWIGCCGYPGCVPCDGCNIPNCGGCPGGQAGDWDLSPQTCNNYINPIISTVPTYYVNC